MNVQDVLIDLAARRATIIRELEVLSVFRGGGPDPAAVSRLRSELAEIDARIAALQAGKVLV